MQNRLVDEEIGRARRAPAWTESIAVGDRAYLQQVRTDLGLRGPRRKIRTEGDIQALSEPHPEYWPISDSK
jgi:hypothetical protein